MASRKTKVHKRWSSDVSNTNKRRRTIRTNYKLIPAQEKIQTLEAGFYYDFRKNEEVDLTVCKDSTLRRFKRELNSYFKIEIDPVLKEYFRNKIIEIESIEKERLLSKELS